MGSKIGVHIGVGVDIQGPKWGSILGVQNGGPYWGSKMGVHIGGL
jgi:hypothetical protein